MTGSRQSPCCGCAIISRTYPPAGKGGKNRSRAKSDRNDKRELHFKNVDDGQGEGTDTSNCCLCHPANKSVDPTLQHRDSGHKSLIWPCRRFASASVLAQGCSAAGAQQQRAHRISHEGEKVGGCCLSLVSRSQSRTDNRSFGWHRMAVLTPSCPFPEYAQVIKILGGPWLEAYCFDGQVRCPPASLLYTITDRLQSTRSQQDMYVTTTSSSTM